MNEAQANGEEWQEVEVDMQELAEAHLDTLKSEIRHEFSLFSKTKFSCTLSDDQIIG